MMNELTTRTRNRIWHMYYTSMFNMYYYQLLATEHVKIHNRDTTTLRIIHAIIGISALTSAFEVLGYKIGLSVAAIAYIAALYWSETVVQKDSSRKHAICQVLGGMYEKQMLRYESLLDSLDRDEVSPVEARKRFESLKGKEALIDNIAMAEQILPGPAKLNIRATTLTHEQLECIYGTETAHDTEDPHESSLGPETHTK